ncbi:MAG: hypothetical protein HQL63_00910 [Magnetococcales bacterium]|nr:hypothetical protein [Magnetococcales bacterium]MBF0322861.1 hypothetical protein [Magnetococcales bacterium]
MAALRNHASADGEMDQREFFAVQHGRKLPYGADSKGHPGHHHEHRAAHSHGRRVRGVHSLSRTGEPERGCSPFLKGLSTC